MAQKNKKSSAPTPVPEKNNTALIVVFSIVIIVLLAAAALGCGLFLYQKKKGSGPKGTASVNQGVWNRPEDKVTPPVSEKPANLNQNIAENPPAPSKEAEGFLPPAASEKNMGYITKVYTKSSKNYLNIDYIQWLSGTEAEKAMREDGECPQKGECIVLNDYYIRNQNPLIRTFEVSPDAEIFMKTLNSETTGRIDQNRKITFEKLQEIFTKPELKQQYQTVPFIFEIGNNQIVKIVEQYIP